MRNSLIIVYIETIYMRYISSNKHPLHSNFENYKDQIPNKTKIGNLNKKKKEENIEKENRNEMGIHGVPQQSGLP